MSAKTVLLGVFILVAVPAVIFLFLSKNSLFGAPTTSWDAERLETFLEFRFPEEAKKIRNSVQESELTSAYVSFQVPANVFLQTVDALPCKGSFVESSLPNAEEFKKRLGEGVSEFDPQLQYEQLSCTMHQKSYIFAFQQTLDTYSIYLQVQEL